MGPLIVFGTGGSGTRAIADFLINSGVFMGAKLNKSFDSLPFASLLDQFLPSWLASARVLDDTFNYEAFDLAWEQARTRHLEGYACQLWGAKNPRMILLIDLLIKQFPEARFIHVVRNGIDMAFSSNLRQLKLYGDLILGPDPNSDQVNVRALEFWARVNSHAFLRAGGLGGRYGLVRYEDFCMEPEQCMRRVCDQLGIELIPHQSDQARYSLSNRKVPSDWYSQIGDAIKEVRPVLEMFGYQC